MSKCQYSRCDIELDNPKANTCCDAHRKAWKRENPDKQPTRTVNNPDNTPLPGQPIKPQPVDYTIILDVKAYGRPAVAYKPDTYATRPEPDNPTDIPCPDNRCAYTRRDGTKYMIDACGQSFDRINGQYQPDVRPRRPA